MCHPDPAKSPPKHRYATGDRVRVRRGIMDPAFPDLPIGGWAGTVAIVEDVFPSTYLIRWSPETLLAIHPIHRNRAERDGFDISEMWLQDDDLESDDGTKVAVEQPTKIVTKPLSMADQDDRIRVVFGLTSDDLLPEVNDKTLRAYHEYLSRHLRFPIEAKWEPEHGPTQPITILGLSEPDEDVWEEGMCGLLCRAKLKKEEIEVALADCVAKARSPGRQLVADYGCWFGNFR